MRRKAKLSRSRLDDGSVLGDGAQTSETIAPSDQYAELVDVFGRAITGETPLAYGAADAVQNMKILDALFASADQGGWVDVA